MRGFLGQCPPRDPHVGSTVTKRLGRCKREPSAEGEPPCRTPTVSLTKASQSHQMVMSQCGADGGRRGYFITDQQREQERRLCF